MARTRTTYTGDPGEVWTNETGKVQFQFIANWINTCGLCCQFDSQIGASWPIPLHRSCRCKQVLVAPGQQAQPFTDFHATISKLDPTQQSKVVGRSNLTLIEKGVVKWEDVVTRTRVRDFREVVAKNSLSVKEMVKAGVNPRLATEAYTTVHTPAHELAAQQRQSLLDQLTKTGLTKDQVRQALAERLAARIGINRGPSGPGPSPIVPGTPGPKPPPVTPPVLPARVKRKPPPIPIPIPLISGGSPEAIEKAYLASLGVKAEAIEQVQDEPIAAPGAGENWTVSPDQAKDWVKDSVFPATLYHRTYAPAKADIEANGINMKKTSGVYGQGLYASTKQEKAFGPETVEVALNIRNPLIGTADDIHRLQREWGPPGIPLHSTGFRDEVVKRGYDSVIMHWEPTYQGPSGANWVVVMKPETARFVQR